MCTDRRHRHFVCTIAIVHVVSYVYTAHVHHVASTPVGGSGTAAATRRGRRPAPAGRRPPAKIYPRPEQTKTCSASYVATRSGAIRPCLHTCTCAIRTACPTAQIYTQHTLSPERCAHSCQNAQKHADSTRSNEPLKLSASPEVSPFTCPRTGPRTRRAA